MAFLSELMIWENGHLNINKFLSVNPLELLLSIKSEMLIIKDMFILYIIIQTMEMEITTGHKQILEEET